MFCTKCGKQIPEGMTSCPECEIIKRFCKHCGTEIPFGAENCPKCAELHEHKDNTEGESFDAKLILNRVISYVKRFGIAKIPFIATISLFVFNIIMSSFPMVRISILNLGKFRSFIGLMKYLKNDLGINSGDPKTVGALLTIGTLALIASILIMILPVVFNRRYSRSYLIMNYITCIYVFLLYLVITLAYSDQGGSLVGVEMTAMPYFYLIETVACLISTAVFGSKLKKLVY